MSGRYEWPVIQKHDGLFKGEVLLKSREYDVALLVAREKLADFSITEPKAYPSIAASTPLLGLSVGFLNVIDLGGETDKKRHIAFSQASISYFFEDETDKGIRYALTGGFIQHGFSGGPVFTSDLELVGLIVMSQRFALDMEQPLMSIYNLPVMSPLASLKNKIETIIASQ